MTETASAVDGAVELASGRAGSGWGSGNALETAIEPLAELSAEPLSTATSKS
jgi:hypothetical protein